MFVHQDGSVTGSVLIKDRRGLGAGLEDHKRQAREVEREVEKPPAEKTATRKAAKKTESDAGVKPGK